MANRAAAERMAKTVARICAKEGIKRQLSIPAWNMEAAQPLRADDSHSGKLGMHHKCIRWSAHAHT